MPRPRRSIVPLDAEATTTRTEALDAAVSALPSPVEPVPPEPAPQPPQRTPERQRLAHAIETVRQLEAEIREAGAAKSEAEEQLLAASCAKRDAEEALQRARPREVGTWTPGHPPVQAPWGGTYNTQEEAERGRRAAERPPLSIADAKAALEIATDAHDSTKRAVQHYGAQIDRASERLRWARGAIETAVRAVVQSDPATLALAQECRRLATRAEAAKRAFSTILGPHVVQRGSPFYGWDSVPDARTSPEAREDWSLSRAWSEALDALASDPDAPLPAA